MASKYAAILGRLPRLLGTEPAYQEKVNAVKTAITEEVRENTGMPPSAIELAKRYREQREQKEALESQLSDVNLVLEALTQLMVDQYEVEGTASVKLVSGESLAVQPEPYAQVQDRDKFREWCLNNGLERSLMLPWQTTNAITKQRLLDGEPEPDGVVCHVKHKVVMRKG